MMSIVLSVIVPILNEAAVLLGMAAHLNAAVGERGLGKIVTQISLDGNVRACR